nr:unnamed protein product [Callosobruchus analis]
MLKTPQKLSSPRVTPRKEAVNSLAQALTKHIFPKKEDTNKVTKKSRKKQKANRKQLKRGKGKAVEEKSSEESWYCRHEVMVDMQEHNEFLHACVDDLIGKGPINPGNFETNDTKWTKDNFEKTVKCVKKLYRRAALEGALSLDNSRLVDNVADIIKKCYEIRKTDIQNSLMKELLLKKGDCLVENIDWKLKWILGSSDLASLREPLLQVILHCVQKHDIRTEKNVIQFEADLYQVDFLVQELMKLKQILQLSK